MALPITFNNTVYPAGFLGIDDGAASTAFNIDSASTYSVSVTGTVTGTGSTVNLTYGANAPAGYAGTTIQLTASQFDNSTMIEFTSTAIPPGETTAQTYRYVLSNTQVYGNPPPTGQTRTRFTADSNGTVGDYNVAGAPCFASGTVIRVLRDDVECDIRVEDLRVGDLAVTAAGAHRAVRWLGHRTVDCARHRDPQSVMPVRISAHAFGPDRPARDLRVSPGHAICLDLVGEVLIPAASLVNGATVAQEQVDAVTYWHVELDSHDVILADNLPCESYLDMGNRAFFTESGVVDLAASPDADAAARTHADFCRPFHDAGSLVDAVRVQLRRRAERLGWRLVAADDIWADVHLLVDGHTLRPRSEGLSACFDLPAEAKDVWLVSPVGVPCDIGGKSDPRALGLCLAGLRLDDGPDARAVALDDPRLDVGFHVFEESHRWTAGRAWLPAELWAGLEGTVQLRLDLVAPPLPRWVAPEVIAQPNRSACASAA